MIPIVQVLRSCSFRVAAGVTERFFQSDAAGPIHADGLLQGLQQPLIGFQSQESLGEPSVLQLIVKLRVVHMVDLTEIEIPAKIRQLGELPPKLTYSRDVAKLDVFEVHAASGEKPV